MSEVLDGLHAGVSKNNTGDVKRDTLDLDLPIRAYEEPCFSSGLVLACLMTISCFSKWEKYSIKKSSAKKKSLDIEVIF